MNSLSIWTGLFSSREGEFAWRWFQGEDVKGVHELSVFMLRELRVEQRHSLLQVVGGAAVAIEDVAGLAPSSFNAGFEDGLVDIDELLAVLVANLDTGLTLQKLEYLLGVVIRARMRVS